MRYLAVTALAFSAAVFAANYILPFGIILYISAVFFIISLLLVFLRRRWLMGFRLAFIGLAAGLLAFWANAELTTVPVAELNGETLNIEAVVLDFPQVYDDYTRLEIRMIGDGLPKIKGYLYDNDLLMTDVRPGRKISFEARIRSADTRYGKDYDYYNSKDIYFIASSASEPLITEGSFNAAILPALIRHRFLCVIDEIFPDDTSAFMSSLLLGEKTRLYENIPLYTDLSRAGLMHVTAVSGMHIAFLVGMIQLLFGCSAASSVLCMLLIWGFAILTGANPSAVRAAFMQSLLLMAPVFRRENDPPTTLSAALAFVLLFNPYASAGVSLQLSFGAMAGLLCFSKPVLSVLESLIPWERARRILHYPFGILAASLSVMVFTLPLCALHFGYVTVLSPISNMLSLWAVSLCFMGGFVCCVLGLFLPGLAQISAFPISSLAGYIFRAAGLVADVPVAVIYLSNDILKLWFILSCIIFALIGLSRCKAVLKLLLPSLLSALMLFAALSALRIGYRHGAGSLAVVDVGQGQSIVAVSGDSCVVVDCGGGGKIENAGEITGAYLLSRGVREVDALLLTHLHSDHVNGLLYLMELVKVERIYMPNEPLDEEGILEAVLESASRHGTQICYVSGDVDLEYGSLSLEMYEPGSRGEANERCVMCRLCIAGYDMLITADASSSAEREFIEKHDVSGVDVLVVGHHGSRYSSTGDFLKAVSAPTAVISVGYNTYGHPTHEVLERLDACGYNIYRTDLNGTVEIRIG